MRQIRERDLVAGKVLLLGKHPLVALESLVQLRQEGLDALVIGFALALHGLPDLFVGELCNRGIKVGLFDGHGLALSVQSPKSPKILDVGPTCWYRA